MNTLRKMALISLLFLSLCPVASYAKTDEVSMLAQAKEQFSAGNYYFASTWLERILRDYPRTTRREEVLVLMSKAFAASGRTEKAAAALKTLLNDFPKKAMTLDPALLKLAGISAGPGTAPSAEAAVAEAKAAEARLIARAAEAKVAAEQEARLKAAEAGAAEAKAAEAKAAAAAEARGAETKAAEAKAAAALNAARVEAFARKLAEQKGALSAAAERVARAKAAEAEADAAKAEAEAEAKEIEAREAQEKKPESKAGQARRAKAKALAEAKSAEEKAAAAKANAEREGAAKAAEAEKAKRSEAEEKVNEQKMFAELQADEKRNTKARAAEEAADRRVAEINAEQRAAGYQGALQKGGPPDLPSAPLPPAAALDVSSAAVARPAPVPAEPRLQLATPTPVTPLDESVAPVPRVEPAGNDLLPAKPSPAAKTVTYTLQIGEFVAEQAMVDAKRKLQDAGLRPEVEQGSKRKQSRTRLSVGEYPRKEDAKKQLNKLRVIKIAGFYLLETDQKYHVYVGSYSDEKSAAKECERIAALGIKASLKHVVVAVPTFQLTAGIFPTRVDALAKALELEKQGMNPVVIEHSTRQELP